MIAKKGLGEKLSKEKKVFVNNSTSKGIIESHILMDRGNTWIVHTIMRENKNIFFFAKDKNPIRKVIL